ncbi:MAG: undecaprenyl-phosphate glucose phosphotransferase [Chloroflexia bacterium]
MADTVAAATSPVAPPKPQQAPARPQLHIDGATGISGRARGDNQGASSPSPQPVIPTPPSTPQPPTRATPLVLFLSQTLLDMLAIAGAFSLAYLLRFYTDILPRFVQPDIATYTTMLVVTLATIIVTFYFSKLYNLRRGASRVDEFYKIAGAVSMGTVMSLATNSLILGDRFVYSRQILLVGWVLAIVFVTTGRLLHSFVLGQLRRRGIDRARVVVVGMGSTAAVVVNRLRQHNTLGYEVVGVVDDSNGSPAPNPYLNSVPVLGDLAHMRDLVRGYNIDEVIVALSGASDRDLREVIERLQDESVSIKIYPDAFQLMTEHEVSVGELSGLPLLSVKDVALKGLNRRVKRAFDVLFSATILVLIAPVMLLIAVAVKLSSRGPVFFIQERVGLDGKPFALVKFRTMRVQGDDGSGWFNLKNPPGWTAPNDPRRTPIGAFLRRFSLDELPQFYNVLVGEMSIVGPRPEQPYYVKEFAQIIPAYARRHKEKSGLTGWAQVNGLRGDTSIKERTDADLYYVENWSLLFDLKIIARTVYSMVRGKNAY